MKYWKRLLFYLFINVVVSSCTIYLVLLAWDRTHNPAYDGQPLFSFKSSKPPTPILTPRSLVTSQPLPTPTPVYVIHTVVEGDTFDSIAAQYGVTVEQLIMVNGFTKSQPLGPGEVLRVPVASGRGSEPEVVIDSVIGPGDLDSERVVLKLVGEGELSLAGWKLEDADGNVFTFPALELAVSGTSVSVYTGVGKDNPEQLHWGLDVPVWQPGETVTLRDAKGIIWAAYKVP